MVGQPFKRVHLPEDEVGEPGEAKGDDVGPDDCDNHEPDQFAGRPDALEVSTRQGECDGGDDQLLVSADLTPTRCSSRRIMSFAGERQTTPDRRLARGLYTLHSHLNDTTHLDYAQLDEPRGEQHPGVLPRHARDEHQPGYVQSQDAFVRRVLSDVRIEDKRRDRREHQSQGQEPRRERHSLEEREEGDGRHGVVWYAMCVAGWGGMG